MSTPSAPVAATIAATLRANRARDAAVRAPRSNPAVSPQPPTATSSFVPGPTCARTAATVVNSGHSVRASPSSSLNTSDGMNASAMCVRYWNSGKSVGRRGCCLLGQSIAVLILPFFRTHPVR